MRVRQLSAAAGPIRMQVLGTAAHCSPRSRIRCYACLDPPPAMRVRRPRGDHPRQVLPGFTKRLPEGPACGPAGDVRGVIRRANARARRMRRPGRRQALPRAQIPGAPDTPGLPTRRARGGQAWLHAGGHVAPALQQNRGFRLFIWKWWLPKVAGCPRNDGILVRNVFSLGIAVTRQMPRKGFGPRQPSV